MADTWKVVRRRNGRESVLFDGNENDVRKYVSNNFPRVHAEPGSPDSPVADVLVKSPTDDYSAFHGPETGFVDTDEDGTPTDSNDDNDDDDDDEPARPVAKKTAAKKTAAAPAFTGGR